MMLGAVMGHLLAVLRKGSWAIDIEALTDDSRKVRAGSLFICIRGMETDGHRYIREALERGAAALLVDERFCGEPGWEAVCAGEAAVVSVSDTRAAAAQVAAAFYGHPSRQLKVIGITGTKGKTTTAFMIRDILEKAGYKTGLLGTIDYEVAGERMPSERTTPEAVDIQRYLRQMADAGCSHAVMEVSSQGLKLHRVDAIAFDVGVFTNLGHDHISASEHAGMEEYAACKAMLFQRCRIGIGNRDDAWYDAIFRDAVCERQTFSCEREADLQATDVTLVSRDGSLGTLFRAGGEAYALAIPGKFSVYNALAAIAVCSQYAIPAEVMREALADMTVRGRVEAVGTELGYRVFIDYAHNALSLKNVLTTLRRYHPYRLMVLFGCGGGRSRTRRREMGQVAGKYADFTVITSDNPRYEEPQAIMREIREGVEENRGEYVMIEDRREAIRYLLARARPGDIVVLAGKGHEMEQEIKGQKYPFDERQIVRDILRERTAADDNRYRY